jgi:hypothetical protein
MVGSISGRHAAGKRKDRRAHEDIVVEHVPPPEPKLLEVFPNRPPPDVLPPPKGDDVDPKPR